MNHAERMSDEAIARLVGHCQRSASEIASAGHNGWGNVCTDAATALESLQREIADLRRDAEMDTKRVDYLQTLVRPVHGEFFYNIGNELSLQLATGTRGSIRAHIDAALAANAPKVGQAENEGGI